MDIVLGENSCWSPLGLKGLNYRPLVFPIYSLVLSWITTKLKVALRRVFLQTNSAPAGTLPSVCHWDFQQSSLRSARTKTGKKK